MERRAERARPGTDRRPIPRVARRHAVEWKAQLRRVDGAAKQLDGYRRKPGSRRERLVKLGACVLLLFLGGAERAEREDRHR
jgi:hypothetical protein